MAAGDDVQSCAQSKKIDRAGMRQPRRGAAADAWYKAAQIGVSKVNINSDMRIAFRNTLEKVLRENPDEYAVVKLMPEVYKAVEEVVESKIQAFGSAGKALA